MKINIQQRIFNEAIACYVIPLFITTKPRLGVNEYAISNARLICILWFGDKQKNVCKHNSPLVHGNLQQEVEKPLLERTRNKLEN